MAAGLYYELKKANNINVELVQESVKDKVYEGVDDLNILPVLNVAQQYYKYLIYDGQLDYVISDSPIMLAYVYGSMSDAEIDVIREWHWNHPSLNFFLKRNPARGYNTVGRIHTEEESKRLDEEILQTMESELGEFWIVPHDDNVVSAILERIKHESPHLWRP